MKETKIKELQQIGDTIKEVGFTAEFVQFPSGSVWAWVFVEKNAPKDVQKGQIVLKLKKEAKRLKIKVPTLYHIIQRS